MSSVAITAKSTTIGHRVGSTGSYVPFAEITDSSMPEINGSVLNADHYGTGAWTEKKAGPFKEGTAMNLTVHYVKAEMTTILGLVNDDTVQYQITLPDASTIAFPGCMTKTGMPLPLKDLIKQNITIEPIGAITFTPGA